MDLEKLKQEMAAATRVVDVYKLQNDAVDAVLGTIIQGVSAGKVAAINLCHEIQALGLSRRIELRHCEGGA